MADEFKDKGVPDISAYHTRESEERYHKPHSKEDPFDLTKRNNRFVCWHCGGPFIVSRNARKLQLIRDGIIKRPLCAPCDKRDIDLSAAVNQCLKMLGGHCSVADVLALYTDERRAKQYFRDPYKQVRMVYKGKDALCMRDIEGWLEDGTLRTEDDGSISAQTKSYMRELEFRAQVREVKEDIRRKETPPPPELDDGSIAVSRRKEDGGASVGAHYRNIMKEL